MINLLAAVVLSLAPVQQDCTQIPNFMAPLIITCPPPQNHDMACVAACTATWRASMEAAWVQHCNGTNTAWNVYEQKISICQMQYDTCVTQGNPPATCVQIAADCNQAALDELIRDLNRWNTIRTNKFNAAGAAFQACYYPTCCQ